MNKVIRTVLGVSPLLFLCSMGCGGEAEPLRVQVSLHDATQHLRASVTRELASGESLHVRVRQGDIGDLDCAAQSDAIERIDGRPVEHPFDLGPTFEGPAVDDAMFVNPYDNSWLSEMEPTAEMLASLEDANWLIDVCLMNGSTVILQDSKDIMEALDELGSNGKFDGEPEERIESGVAYAEACIAQMGEIPFFPMIKEGDYETYNCLDSTPIPMTVTTDDTVEFPEESRTVCDNPEYIYSSCEPNAVSGRTNGPRVTSASNDQGTHWVLLCRKAKSEEGEYNDIAMIGSNPYTGATCFFQNALYSKTDGLHVPHPADRIESEESPQESASLWKGIEGGIGNGIECAECHSYDAFIHTPWIDGALDDNGDPVVPKMGVSEDWALGFNEMPYWLVNAEGQGWRMEPTITSPEVGACTQCHRASADRWTRSWLNRLDGNDTSWTNITTPAYQEFEHAYWMPPDLEGLSQESFAESEYGKALDFMRMCATNRDAAGCEYGELPQAQLVDVGEPVVIDLEGRELALEAAKILGSNVVDPDDERCNGPDGSCATRRCAECHSPSENGLNHWSALTRAAWEVCGLDRDPETMTAEEAVRTIDCMRVDAGDPNSVFAAEKIGILTSGVQYGYFRQLFRQAYGDGWLPLYLRFRARVSMPKGNHPRLTEIEYATVLKWFQEGLNDLEDIIVSAPAPETCEPYVSPEMATHIDTMQFEGWRAVNEDNGIRMFGCTGTECLTSYGDRSRDWGAGVGIIRELHQFDFKTSFWTRSSADGRFVGNGGGNGARSTITDLQRGLDIGIDASYDPGFFPDNSGWIFQGGGAHVCTQSLLETDTSIDFSEEGCSTAREINLYQHVARGISGGDYFIINSQFTSDAGRSDTDPRANFAGESTMKFTPMVFDGTNYSQFEAVIVDSPFEGDSVLSPSTQLVISRLAGPESESLGYVIRKVDATRTGENYRISIGTEVPGTNDGIMARVCIPGAKANISFDERFFVTHHYHDGTSDIFIHDMMTGETQQVTSMSGEARALFPHFRSDNWFYFLVKDGENEYLAASDAAITLAASSRR